MWAATLRSRVLLIVLSPAKRLDFTEADAAIPATDRRFLEDTASLSKTAKRQTKADLRRLMGISTIWRP